MSASGSALRWPGAVWASDARLRAFLDAVESWWFLQPMGRDRLAALSGLGDELRFLRPDGRNFPTWYLRASTEQARIPDFLRAISKVLPGFRGPRGPKPGSPDPAGFDFSPVGRKGGSVVFSWDELSDGQRTLLVLYAVLHFGLPEGGLLVVDEPEAGVALAELDPWLRALQDAIEDGAVQAMVISHHPEFLNPLAREHGTRFERDPAGPVRIRTTFPETGFDPAETIARGWDDAVPE